MVLIIRCPACGYKLRFADDQAGQSVRCFSCKHECTLPSADESYPGTDTPALDEQIVTRDLSEPENASLTPPHEPANPPQDQQTLDPAFAEPGPQTPLADPWWAQTANGDEYGPVTNSELENWVREGRLDRTCRIRQGEGMWHPAEEIWPDLRDEPESQATYTQPSHNSDKAADSPFAPVTLVEESPFQATDSDNPFQPPQQEDVFDTPVTMGFSDEQIRAQLRARLQLPGLLLAIFAGLMIAFQILGTGINLFNGSINSNAVIAPFTMQMNSTVIALIASLVISVGSSIVTLIGALKMRQLKSYGLSVTACVLPMIPCLNSCCCVLALPLGTWGLIVLLDPNVRTLFNEPTTVHEGFA